MGQLKCQNCGRRVDTSDWTGIDDIVCFYCGTNCTLDAFAVFQIAYNDIKDQYLIVNPDAGVVGYSWRP